MSAKSNTSSVPSREQFIAEYMAKRLNGERKPKVSLLDRISMFIENRAVDAVADSKRIGGRLSAAWDAAEEGFDEAFALETARQAERSATRLGLK